MNWLLIVGVLFLAWNIAWGYNRGFLRVLYSLGKWVLIIVMLLWLTPILSKSLESASFYDEMYMKVEARIENQVRAHMEEKAQEKFEAEQDSASLQMQLPKAIQDKVPNVIQLADGTLRESGAYEAAAKEMTDLAMLGIAAIFVIILCIIICVAINRLFHVIEKLPGIEQVNNTLGIFAGVFKGMLLMWIGMAILAAESGTAVGNFLIPYIYESPILQIIYENNLVLTLMMAFF